MNLSIKSLLAVLCLCLLAASPLVAAQRTATTTPETIDICDRTAQVEAGILAALELDADDCAAVPAERMAAIRFMDLGRAGIATLRVGDFDNLDGLRQLNLHHNQMETLPSSIFDALNELRYLLLNNNNQLATLPSGVFDALDGLKHLFLHSNRLAALPAGIFDELDELNWLWLNGNQLRALPSGIFDNLDRLDWLSLGVNRLRALPPGIFDELDGLRDIHLNDNDLETLPAGAFDKLVALETLDLGDNDLETLPAGIFGKLAALDRLDLNGNRLAGLAREHPLFDNLPSGVALLLSGQRRPNPPPPCQPEGGFPSEGDGCRAAPEPDPPAPPGPGPEPEPGPEEPDPPADGDLAGRVAALERQLAVLMRRTALDADERREADAALQRRIEDATAERMEADAAHDERLSAIEESIPPRRLRLWSPPSEE